MVVHLLNEKGKREAEDEIKKATKKQKIVEDLEQPVQKKKVETKTQKKKELELSSSSESDDSSSESEEEKVK